VEGRGTLLLTPHSLEGTKESTKSSAVSLSFQAEFRKGVEAGAVTSFTGRTSSFAIHVVNTSYVIAI